MGTYTFGLRYPAPAGSGYEDQIEEIDVQADNHSEAQAAAIKLAKVDYMPGWTELISLPRGGSGGWVSISSH